jgi:hypothetical protein
MFKGVSVINLPRTMRGVTVRKIIDPAEWQSYVPKLTKLSQEKSLWVITEASGEVWYVVALVFLWHEDDGEYNDPSQFANSSWLGI